MQNFRNLDVWGKAHKLTIDVYRATAMFPKSELYGLTSQMRRASASIGANMPRGVADEAILSLAGSCTSQWDRRVNSNITFSSREIFRC